jgi:hypothetical protein
LLAICDEMTIRQAIHELRGIASANRTWTPGGHLHAVNFSNHVAEDSLLVKRYNLDFQLVESAGQVKLLFPGNTVVLPAETLEVLQPILDAPVVSLRSLPEVDKSLLVGLLQRLIGEGFLIPLRSEQGNSLAKRSLEISPQHDDRNRESAG